MPTLLPTPDIAATLAASPPSRELGPYPSPDNLLEAVVHIHDCTPLGDGEEYAFERLTIRQTNTTVEQEAANQLIRCGALGAFGLEGLYWSQNGRYFYYTNAREGMPDGCGYWQPPMIRYDIVSGLNVPLGAGPLAADELKLATWQNDQLMIWSLSNTTPMSVFDPAVPGELPGPIAWSRDSEFVAYLQSPSWCPAGPTSVILVSLQTGQQQVVVSAHEPGFTGVEWSTPRILTLFSESGDSWTYDIQDAELSGPHG